MTTYFHLPLDLSDTSVISSPHSKSDMSRLRLAAGGAIMKLAQEPCYHDIITPEQFQLCGLVINVSLTPDVTSFTGHFNTIVSGGEAHDKMNDG